ncbi:MAG: nickel pincer cofactor biosynthesis protein LarB [Thermodesulfobacteriota bacterium]
MDEAEIRRLLEQVAAGQCGVAEAVSRLKHFPAEMLHCAQLDHHRRLRTGLPEVVYGENKSAGQIVEIMGRLLPHASGGVMATRVDAAKGAAVVAELPGLVYHPDARMLTSPLPAEEPGAGKGLVVVLGAGTSDLPVVAEAELTLRCLGIAVRSACDVGVAGIHRLLSRRDLLEKATVLVVVAGMEGALPSVVAGLVDKPVIAVPTSVGYGTGLGGIAALLGMLNSCAPGVVVVNIDNGFGAACAAASMLRQISIHG